MRLSKHILGSWSFGSDKWWGHQDDRESRKVLDVALDTGINVFDTAPAYGRGHSEELIGSYIKLNGVREKVILMTKFGLRWQERNVEHDLSKKHMEFELDQSRKRLQTDYFDVYFAHWPDPKARVEDLAERMYKLYEKKIIKKVGLSNFSQEQVELFIKYCPLHIVQSPYSMLNQDNADNLFRYCKEKEILVTVYSPLERGVLTGKFFLANSKIPKDLNRKYHQELEPERFDLNKKYILKLNQMAKSIGLSLAQLVIAWTIEQHAVDSLIIGSRNVSQLKENATSFMIEIPKECLKEIDEILKQRKEEM